MNKQKYLGSSSLLIVQNVTLISHNSLTTSEFAVDKQSYQIGHGARWNKKPCLFAKQFCTKLL